MSCGLFPVPFFNLLLLLFCLLGCCTLCGAADTTSDAWPMRDGFMLFVPESNLSLTNSGNYTGSGFPVRFVSQPSLVSANNLLVAFCTASRTLGGDGVVLARYFLAEGRLWTHWIGEGAGRNWNSQLVMQKMNEGENVFSLRDSSAVAKGNKIYLLVLTYKNIGQNNRRVEFLDWEFDLMVGEVKSVRKRRKLKRTIEWRSDELTSMRLTQQLKNMSLRVSYLNPIRSSFLTQDGKIVFAVNVTKEDKDGTAIIYLNDTETSREWDWSYVETFDGCYSPYFFSWKGKLNMVSGICDGDGRKVMVSSDMGKTWADSDGAFSLLLSSVKNAMDFTPATINNKTVLLFTQPIRDVFVPTNSTLFLWFFDGSRIFNVGRIVTYGVLFPGGNLLHTDSGLFSLHHLWGIGRTGILFARHKTKLRRIVSVLSAWNKTDAYLSQSCNETTLQNASSSGSICVTPMPTNGLIGFLSDNISKSIYLWHDEYFYRGAIVRGAKKVTNGFLFDRPAAGAKWGVGTYWRQYGYNFGKDGLTLVATVAIHNVVSGSSSPLLTVDSPANERRGLYCSGDKTFKVVSGQSQNATFVGEWETDQTYRVALLLEGNTSNFSAHVIGGSFSRASPISASFGGSNVIESVFIGGYEDDGGLENAGAVSNLTVTNVFLYNRLLSGAELNALGGRS